MEPSAKLKVTTERKFSAHHLLIRTARLALDDAKAKRPGWFNSQLVAITLCALSIEAICNSIGDRVIPNWKDFESSSPIAKLRILCDHLKVHYDTSEEPWTSARWLYKFRNLIAHAKPELILEEELLSREEYDNRHGNFPMSKLEKQITFDNAIRALQTAEKIKDILCAGIPPENAIGLYADASWGRATPHNDN